MIDLICYNIVLVLTADDRSPAVPFMNRWFLFWLKCGGHR